ncbi:GYD domain-containing protein [Saccharopolyspora erythraea]|uniref:GYD domain-containing protein n=1 Tax=Saccharopolyspora erythraea TaxID=1836 RepID=UPI0001D30E1F|nr:GYD domain-containing protein [Saccharopolyspora erythraea]EQD87845.1 GYD family protein [Saccharopolyspora erythraea D]QRK87727.1 GYD domain-containing protein [Saccharopolyspora erythraea]
MIEVPKYLVRATYTADGVKGVLREGGTARVDAVRNMITRLGGEVESFYFAFGDYDVYVVVDLPDNVSAASVGLTITGSGAVRSDTVVLLTPGEVDEAVAKEFEYRPPGG